MDQHESLQRDLLNGTPDDKAKSDGVKAGAPPSNGPPTDAVMAGQPPPEFVPPANQERDAPPSWFASNGPALIICLLVLGYLIYAFPLEGLLSIGKAALGLSLVIFIHELGHFLVAKWCDVHVTTFSIGFGPPIPGCHFKWGETTYKLALFPLGGYVQMVGQIDGDEGSDGSEDDPRSYRNKNVWQRMAIISAGVIMNVILAVVCFVVVFRGPGKDRMEASIAVSDTNSPAFIEGIMSSTEITEIGSLKDPFFEDVKRHVMGSQKGEAVGLGLRLFTLQGQDDKGHWRYTSTTRNIEVEPRKESKDLAPMIGFAPASRLQLSYRKYLDSSFTTPTRPFSPASKVSQGFQFADRIVGSSYDPKDPKKVKDLPPDPRFPEEGQPGYPGYKQCDYFEFARRMQDLAGQTVTIEVERQVDEHTTEKKKIEVEPAFNLSLGTVMRMGEITAIRKGSPAAQWEGADGKEIKGATLKKLEDKAIVVDGDGKEIANAKLKIRPRTKDKKDGDKIIGASCKTKKGQVVWGDKFNGAAVEKGTRTLDPMRLPLELRKEMADADGPKKVTLYLQRVNDNGPATINVTSELDWQDSWAYDRAEPFTAASPWAINELGLAYLVMSSVAEVSEPEKNLLHKGDDIKKFKVTYLDSTGKEKKGEWTDLENPDEWAWFYFNIFLNGSSVKSVSFKVNRDQKEEELADIVPVEDKTWPKVDRGLILMPDFRRQKADSVIDAVALGIKDTHNSIIQVFQTLRGMIGGRLSVKNLGGPLTIANTAYRIAGVDFSEFIFFLGLISVNLAVINFLPIPVLDGGHMVFLLYEKIRGHPASEGVRAGATYVGLLLILCLMVFVLYLDVTRLFW